MSGTRSGTSFAAILILVLLAATPVLAKEGGEARLDTAIPRDAQPGSTLEVGWSTFVIADGKEQPIYGSPIYIKLVSPIGSSTEAPGTESPSGSGHYTASIVVPEGGIDQVIVGLAGYACYQGGDCERADYVFPLTDDPLVIGASVPRSTVDSGTPAPIWSGLALLVAIGVMSAFAAGLGSLIATRRRHVRVETAGGASGH
ncbi:MAG TPA: hypothetical protein VGQ89_05115 [Candidatus Limnocylindrales bacterium]|jgi:hypothetical protein|nr:hypothetical protein [Candidatus Limnocylindrales bacterium]